MHFRSIVIGAILSMMCCVTAYAEDYKPIEEGYESLGVVECPKYLNIRQTPSTESKVVGLIQDGAGCEVVRVGDTWCVIKSGAISGYVKREYLLIGDDALERAEELATRRIRFNSAGVIHSAKSASSRVWERPLTGNEYEVVDDSNGWIQIDVDGAIGYVPDTSNVERYYGLNTATYTYDLTYVEGKRKDVVKYAMQFLGKPYVWGGNNPYTGADCSGFVKYVYLHCLGIGLPRVSYEQCYIGKKITSMEMQPGDLIYYADNNGTVGHVAMYIGNGMIIHAASSKSGVKLSEWNYRTPKYIRNVID